PFGKSSTPETGVELPLNPMDWFSLRNDISSTSFVKCSTSQTNMLIRFWCVAFTVLLIFSGCRSSGTVATDNAFSTEESSDLNYRLIYIIHGDANYLYHDTAGRSLQSDEPHLRKAGEVAEQAKNGEVFLYHQRPQTKILWLLPQKDRRMLHYRKRKRIHHKKYSPVSEIKAFLSESR